MGAMRELPFFVYFVFFVVPLLVAALPPSVSTPSILSLRWIQAGVYGTNCHIIYSNFSSVSGFK